MSAQVSGDPWFARLVDVDPDLAARLIQTLARESTAADGHRRSPRLHEILEEVNTPWSVLETLLDEDKAGVVSHANADRAVVLSALDSSSEDVRAAAVSNPVLDFSEVEHLYSTDRSPAVHYAIARRPDASEQFINVVLDDPEPDLLACEAVTRSAQITADQVRRAAEIGIRHASDGSGFGVQILSRLMRHPRTSDEVRALIALVDALPGDSTNGQNDDDAALKHNHVTWLYFDLPDTDAEVVDVLLAIGHPIGLLHEAGTSAVPDDGGASLVRMWTAGLTQRALWPAILHRKDAGLIWASAGYNPSVLMLSVGELRSTDDYEGVDSGDWGEWGLVPALDDVRPAWVTAAPVPLDFAISANYIQNYLLDSSPSELAAYVAGKLFSSGVHLIPDMYPDVTLTQAGAEAIAALPEVSDEWYDCAINHSALAPFDWCALSIERKTTFLRYALGSLDSASPLIRQVAANTVSLIVLAASVSEVDRGLIEVAVPETLSNEQIRECLEFINSDPGDLDDFSLNDHGWILRERGWDLCGLELLRTAALTGLAPSIATLTWQALLAEDFSGHAEIESVALPRMEERGAEMLPSGVQNARSNVALCRLALGGSPQQARETWLNYAERDHLESRFYPAVLSYREGEEAQAAALARVIPRNDRETLREDMVEISETGQGWFRQWVLDGLSVLDLVDSDGTEPGDLGEIISGPLALACSESDHDPDQCPRASAASAPEATPEDLRAWVERGDSCLKIGLARNPAADASILESLSHDEDLAVRNAVLGRPDLPLDRLLIGLASSYSDENYSDHDRVPVHYDWSKMNRDFERGLSDSRVRSILELTAGEDLLREAWAAVLTWTHFTDVDHSDDGHVELFKVRMVRYIVAGTQDMGWIYETLIDRSGEVPQLACAEQEVTHYSGGEDPRREVEFVPLDFHLAAAVALRGAPGDLGKEIAQVGSWELRLILAQHGDTPVEALVEIYQTDAVTNERMPWRDHELSAFSELGIDWEERWPAELGLMSIDDANVVADLDDDLEAAARACAVLHPNFPADLLPTAASDATPAVRAAVARSLRAGDELLQQLAVDSDVHVRRGVSENEGATEEIRALAALQGLQ